MKKILGFLLLSYIVVNSAVLTAPTYNVVTGGWICETGFNMPASEDTLTGVDSLTFSGLTKYTADEGYEYALSIKATTPAADSIRFVLQTYGSDGSTLMNTVTFDTIPASSTDRITQLPLGKTVLGTKFTVRAFTWIAVKVRTLYRIELWKKKLK